MIFTKATVLINRIPLDENFENLYPIVIDQSSKG